MNILRAVVYGLALIVSGCAAFTLSGASPTPQPSRTPGATDAPNATVCAARDTVLRFRGWNGAGGSLQGVIAIANVGKAPCELNGYPTLRLIDLNGRALEVESKVWETYAKPEAVTLAVGTGMLDDPTALLRPGTAFFAFHWSNWCQAGQGPRLIEVSWPGGSSSVPVAAQTPRCDTPAVISVISVGPFEAANMR